MPRNKAGSRKAESRMVLVSALLVVIVVAMEYARITFDTAETARRFIHGMTLRPYVYRTLVPWLARLLVWMGLPDDVALTVVIVCSAIGLFYGIKYFLSSFRTH